jgi:group I intron endonuclease
MIVYKTTCLINNKIYVGKDSKKNARRSLKYLGSGKIFKKAIKKYGKENFKKEILEECYSEEQLNEREKFWIKTLNTIIPNGYNICAGGEGGDNFTNNPDKEEIRKKISEHRKGKAKGEHNAMSKMKGDKHFFWGKKRPNHSKAMSGDKNSSSLLSISKRKNCSIEEAHKFEPLFDVIGINHPKSKSIVQFSKDGEFIKEWGSSRRVEKEIGFSHASIGRTCRGINKSAYGYIWKFKE